MTKRDRTALGKYLRWLANQMGLRDWALLLDHDPPERDDVWATCRPTFGQRRAVLRFAPDVREWDLERLRQVCVHELLHCHLDRMYTIYNTAAGELGAQAQRVSEYAWKSVLEDACDDVATAWAEAMPTMRWPGADPAA